MRLTEIEKLQCMIEYAQDKMEEITFDWLDRCKNLNDCGDWTFKMRIWTETYADDFRVWKNKEAEWESLMEFLNNN